jgi:hypothetical protein
VAHQQRQRLRRPGRNQRLDLGQHRHGGAETPRPPTPGSLTAIGQPAPVRRTVGGPIPAIHLRVLATLQADAVEGGQGGAELSGQPDRRRRRGDAAVHPLGTRTSTASDAKSAIAATPAPVPGTRQGRGIGTPAANAASSKRPAPSNASTPPGC